MRFRPSLTLVFAACLLAVAQDDPPSLADAANKSHKNIAKSKVVVTDDDLDKTRGPFPDMTTDGVYNTDAIIKAMCEFRRAHTAAETESAIRDWYDRYDLMFQQAFDENNAIRTRNQDREAHPPELVYGEDWKQVQQIRQSQMLNDLQDRRRVQKNGLLIARIQQTLQAVRTGIARYGMSYEWMKIRFGNGNGSW